MARLFVTGGSGFVGSRLIPALVRTRHSVAVLDRTGALRRLPAAAGAQIVAGDLLEPHTYRDALRSVDIVVHLAAATGRADRAEHVRINAVGTETLLDACQQAGAPRFLFVSSIAASFPDRRGYHYAEAKVRAEEAVRHSGLAFAILRPTMIFGPGSPLFGGLEKLALLPVIPVFGHGRTLVQPIDVDDVVRSVLRVIDRDLFGGETFEIGGREALPIEVLLQRIRETRRGARGRTIRVPIRLILGPLRAAEAAGLGRLLPVTAGQLSSFRFAGTVSPNALQQALQEDFRGVTEMLAAATPAAAGLDPLDRECRVFTAHLLGSAPDAYVRRKYAEAHQVLPGLSASDRFEHILMGVARRHRTLAAISDAYARIFLPHAVLRRKLVLLLALLETSASSSPLVDREVAGHPAAVMIRLAGRGVIAIARLAAGTAIFVPARLLFAGRAR